MNAKEILTRLDRIEAAQQTNTKPLSQKEAAAYLNISQSHLYRLTSKGLITHYKSLGGKKLSFEVVDLNAWLKSKRIISQAEIEELATDYVNRRGVGNGR